MCTEAVRAALDAPVLPAADRPKDRILQWVRDVMAESYPTETTTPTLRPARKGKGRTRHPTPEPDGEETHTIVTRVAARNSEEGCKSVAETVTAYPATQPLRRNARDGIYCDGSKCASDQGAGLGAAAVDASEPVGSPQRTCYIDVNAGDQGLATITR
ncbi:hypothetical protein GPECTOR_13g763 [Gonium pectorale]|uniref:Uncharacterized protein n=1 Tax=Gonium pectorale TaxID=33097 RepID=A0A150GN30_GONPE|nr:hypothetical protein GPECTOR_13g763 [Gonium pectorale]|eukprot:KXZ51276.1 hypothetical protein GPECTOR_13g763 [Gonium pectorale]